MAWSNDRMGYGGNPGFMSPDMYGMSGYGAPYQPSGYTGQGIFGLSQLQAPQLTGVLANPQLGASSGYAPTSPVGFQNSWDRPGNGATGFGPAGSAQAGQGWGVSSQGLGATPAGQSQLQNQGWLADREAAARPAGVGWGFNPQTIGMGIQGAGVLGNLGLGIASLIEGRSQFSKSWGLAQKNYRNSVTSYNQSREDRIRGRYAPGERTQKQIDDEVKKSQLK